MIFGKHINKYYVKYMHLILLGLFALFLVDYFQLEIPVLYKYVIDGINDGFVVIDGAARVFDMTFVIDEICRPMLGIIVGMIIGRFLWRVTLFGASVGAETSLRGEMFDKCKDLSQSFYHKNKVGNLMSLFTNDLETINECFGWGVMMAFDAILLGVLAIGKMVSMDSTLTLFSMIPMVILLAIATVVGKKMEDKWANRQQMFSTLSDFSQESFSGISVIKAFVKELNEILAFRRLNRKNEEANVDFTRTSILLHILVTLFVESVICVILGYGGYIVYLGKFTPGELIEFMSYFGTIVWPIMAVSQLIEMTSRGAASLKRISDILETAPEISDKVGAISLDEIRGEIEFKSLTFRYPDADYDALLDVSFKIAAGENVGIIGRTGSGKTTLVDLIMRTYNVPDGTLFVDGHDVNDLTVRSVRAAVAYVPQDNFLFSDTIEKNISFATDNYTEDEVKNAAVLSDVDSNISEFTLGYDTVLGERGVTVSGGQKQRISIARALMKNAPILILDDSVSAVDTDTERTIIDNLRRTRCGKTTILIAHRVSTVEKMDKIIFIDDGKVTAVGTHSELLDKSPQYRLTVELQRLEEVGENE